MIYLILFYEFFKIGLFTFGGGYAMIPLISQLIEKYDWATTEQLTNMLAISESTPGPFAINMATFIGVSQAGILGAICSTLGVVLPSFIIILLIAILIKRINMQHPLIQGTLDGVRPVVIAAIGVAFISLICKNLLGNFNLIEALQGHLPKVSDIDFLGIFIASVIGILLIFVKKIGMLSVIAISAVLGIVGNWILTLF